VVYMAGVTTTAKTPPMSYPQHCLAQHRDIVHLPTPTFSRAAYPPLFKLSAMSTEAPPLSWSPTAILVECAHVARSSGES
jgi:hypothetical protein